MILFSISRYHSTLELFVFKIIRSILAADYNTKDYLKCLWLQITQNQNRTNYFSNKGHDTKKTVSVKLIQLKEPSHTFVICGSFSRKWSLWKMKMNAKWLYKNMGKTVFLMKVLLVINIKGNHPTYTQVTFSDEYRFITFLFIISFGWYKNTALILWHTNFVNV